MASTPTKNSVPSENYDDMRFNAGKLDEFVTSSDNEYLDRLGVTHLTARGLQNSVAGALLPGNNLSDVQSGDTSLSNLGGATTGVAVFKAATPAAARSALGAASSGSNGDITELTGINIALSIGQGGTGAKTANAARTNLGLGTLSTQNASNVAITGGSVTGINDLAISDGGTGASSASTARANLGAKADAGVTDASSASEGQVGEVISNQATGVAVTTATQFNATSLNLTPGDWDVYGLINFVDSGSNNHTSLQCSLNITSATGAAFPYRFISQGSFAGSQAANTPRRRFNVSVNTTVYLVGYIVTSASAGNLTASGFIEARRVR